MNTTNSTAEHWSIVLHIESTHLIRDVLMEVKKIDTKKAILEPVDDLLRYDDGDLELWCSRIVCGEYIELEGLTFQVTTVSVKRMTLEACQIGPDTPRWKQLNHFERLQLEGN